MKSFSFPSWLCPNRRSTLLLYFPLLVHPLSRWFSPSPLFGSSPPKSRGRPIQHTQEPLPENMHPPREDDDVRILTHTHLRYLLIILVPARAGVRFEERLEGEVRRRDGRVRLCGAHEPVRGLAVRDHAHDRAVRERGRVECVDQCLEVRPCGVVCVRGME